VLNEVVGLNPGCDEVEKICGYSRGKRASMALKKVAVTAWQICRAGKKILPRVCPLSRQTSILVVVRFYRFTKGLTKFSRKLTNIRRFRKNGGYEKTEDAASGKIRSHEES
jgi:hypothetical protein